MWGQYDCYLTAARDILGLQFSCHEKYAVWEQAAIHGGFRIMHEEFCMVSDFPEILRVDEQNRPHCSDGPSHRWRDGWSLYHIHGVSVDARIVEQPHTITVQECLDQPNAEIRRVMIDRMGLDKFFAAAKPEVLDEDADGQGMPRKLLRIDVADDEPYVVVQVQCPSTGRVYHNPVPPDMHTCIQAVAWRFSMDPESYLPLVEA